MKLFENQGVKLEVNLKDGTVQLSKEQWNNYLSKKKTIMRYIQNIYKDGEFVEN